MKPLFRIFQFSFGCRHRQRSAVFTIKKRTYQVCLKCGQEFGYSWALMHTTRSSVAVSSHVPLPPDHVRPNPVRPNNARPNEAPTS
jgi:hypothetical protein